jgi:hypothetical protein
MTASVTFPEQIVINTNKTFKVAQGQERKHNLIYVVKDGEKPVPKTNARR